MTLAASSPPAPLHLHEVAPNEDHALYLELPALLAPLFPRVSQVQVTKLTLSSYWYFRFLLTVDSLIDTSDAGARPDTASLLTACDRFEKAILGLSQLLPAEDPFWPLLDACKQRYVRATFQEQQLNQKRGDFSREQFEELAAAKSAVSEALVHALARLGNESGPVAMILSCLQHLHVALQYVDDVDDFCEDLDQGQYTYPQAQVTAYLTRECIDPARFSNLELRPFLYTSGTASRLLRLAYAHYQRAIRFSEALQVPALTRRLQEHASRCARTRLSIAVQVRQAHLRVTATSESRGAAQ